MRFIIIDINIDLNIQLRRATIPKIPTVMQSHFIILFIKHFLVYLQVILKSKLVVLAMVITTLTFVVAAVAASSSVEVNVLSLSRRLLKSVQPPPNGLVPPYRLLSGNTLTASSISSNTTKLKEENMKGTCTQRISIEAVYDEESDRGILFAYFFMFYRSIAPSYSEVVSIIHPGVSH